MKNRSSNLKRVLRYLMLIFVVCVALNCTNRNAKLANLDSTDISKELGINDTCSACPLDSFAVRQVSMSAAEKILIDRPTAIQFFNRVWLADRYDNQKSQDTLKKLFGNRSAVYNLRDQYFYFREVMRPMLISNSIKVIDTLSDNRLLELRGIHGSFFVNTSAYKDQDGVLLFTPEKEPVFWTDREETRYCRKGVGLVGQYFFCPENSSSKD